MLSIVGRPVTACDCECHLKNNACHLTSQATKDIDLVCVTNLIALVWLCQVAGTASADDNYIHSSSGCLPNHKDEENSSQQGNRSRATVESKRVKA